jgi:Uma2 family endonuclease
MTALITDPALERRMIARRRHLGIDRFDEVWDGVYIMAPAADNEHSRVSTNLGAAFVESIERPGLGLCFTGPNISDRKVGWAKNFRCPDVAVFLNGNTAENCGDFWFGGPDFAVEIVSPRDRTRKKIPFYEKVGTRELLIVDRRPWKLTLHRLTSGKLVETGYSTFDDPRPLASQVISLTFRLAGDVSRPAIAIEQHDGSRQWTIEGMSKPMR